MTNLSPSARKLVALALLALVILLPLAAAYGVLAAYQANEAQIVEKTEQLGKLEAIAHYASRLDNAAPAPADAAFAGWFLAESDPAIAAANLQARLKSVAQGQTVDVTQANNVKPRTVAGLNFIGVGLDMMGRAEGLHQTLQAIENATPLLVIEKATLRADPSSGDPRYDPVRLVLGIEIWAALPTPVQKPEGTAP